MRPLILLCLALCLLAADVAADTLRGAYDAAGPGGGFDKRVVLEAGRVYTGSLLVGPMLVPETGRFEGESGLDVRIEGNGAVLDLRGGQICISYCENRLEIEDCVVVNGNVRFRGVSWEAGRVPTGRVSQVTFHEPHDYGVIVQGCGDGITVERNLFVDAVDTGPGWVYNNGYPFDWIHTGLSMGLSTFGAPVVVENWSFHTDPVANVDPIRHFGFL